MKLSDIRGERSLDVIADAMELAELIGGDDRYAKMTDELKEVGADGAWKVLCRYLPSILRDDRYKKRVISILATASGVPYEEYAENGSILSDLSELLLSDSEAIGFLASTSTSQK